MKYQKLTAEIDRCKAAAQALGSNSAIEGLMDYDIIFDVTLTKYIDNGEMEEEEADLIWSQGSRYFAIAKATLVA